MPMKPLLMIVLTLFLAGCASSDLPSKNPLTQEELAYLTCPDILADLTETRQMLDALILDGQSGSSPTSVGVGVGIGGRSGGIGFGTNSVPFRFANARDNTQLRYDQLQALAREKSCVLTPETQQAP